MTNLILPSRRIAQPQVGVPLKKDLFGYAWLGTNAVHKPSQLTSIQITRVTGVQGHAMRVTFFDPLTAIPLDVSVGIRWSLLIVGRLVSRSGSYPYILGGSSSGPALSPMHGSVSDRMAWYDGSAIKDTDITLGEKYNTFLITYDGAYNFYSGSKATVGVAGNNISGNFELTNFTSQPNVFEYALIAINNTRAIQTPEALQIVNNPWQIFAPQKRVVYFDAGAGGTYFSKYIADSLTIVDSISNIQVGITTGDIATVTENYPIQTNTQISEDSNIAEAISQLLAQVTTTESAAGLDNISSIEVYLTQIAESGLFTDTIEQILVTVSASDISSAVDSIAKIAEGYVTIAEAGLIADSLSGITVSVVTNDSIAAIDNLILSIAASISETGGFSETISLLTATLITVQDSISGNDSITNLEVSLSLADIAAGTEAITINAIVTLLESAGATDVIVKTDSEAQQITVQFILEARRTDFILAMRGTTFTLPTRGNLK